ncbi:hypothetical protein BH09ACT7_BH09ACT7_19570 [soil metagenome]
MLGRIQVLARALGRMRLATLPRIGDHPRIGRAARCSLTRPAGGDRHLAVTRVRTDDVLSAAHRYGATVNDVLLSAKGGTLGKYLDRRGEHPDDVVLGIPIGMRRAATAEDIGNRASEIRAAIPTAGEPIERLDRVAQIMRISKRSPVGPVMAVIVSAAIRAALAVGIYEPYMRRQRYLHSVVTNVHGPNRQVTICGAPVTDILPLKVGAGGSVTMNFAALSYAGTLAITVIADPDTVPDLAEVTASLDAEFNAVLNA